MATAQLGSVLRHLRRVAFVQDGAGRTDRELLECFVSRRDEAAFTALVRRHGPMVLGVCRRVLKNEADAEDAFQATFLVLVRKAASLGRPELVGNWLYGVARHAALKAKVMDRKRRAKERQAAAVPRAEGGDVVRQELQGLLDQELSRLPDKYRIPLVLCRLEGRPLKEAAGLLGVPPGTVASRLSRGRDLLARRLTRHGLVLAGGTLAGPLWANGVSACVPTPLLASTVKAALLVAAGPAAAAGALPGQVAALTEGVLKGMFLTKLQGVLVVLTAVALIGAGAGVFAHQALAGKPADSSTPAPAPEKDKSDPPKEPGAAPAKDPGQKPGDNPNKDKGNGPVQETVVLTGTVLKQDLERKTDDGGTKTVTFYFLAEAKGNKVPLPPPRKSEAGKVLDDYNLDEFVGKQVVVTGRALTAKQSERADAPRRVTKLITITEIKLKK